MCARERRSLAGAPRGGSCSGCRFHSEWQCSMFASQTPHASHRGMGLGFAIVKHIGRRSGRQYETPVNAFRSGNRYVFALTYGESEWVKNVLAARRCTIRTRRRDIELTDPELLKDPTRHLIPVPAAGS